SSMSPILMLVRAIASL
ncbi:bifunctional nuclease family protein, partial [Chlamydia psittaci 08DC60]